MPTPKFTPHPQSTPGDFYVENEMCTSCGVPHAVAPDLMAWVDGEASHCFWKKQPETSAEIDQAIAVLEAQELGCHRYAGDDPAILRRLSAEYCDYPSPSQRVPRQVIRSVDPPALFRLLEQENGLFVRVWKRLTHKNKKQTD
jgi:hypothetical protein